MYKGFSEGGGELETSPLEYDHDCNYREQWVIFQIRAIDFEDKALFFLKSVLQKKLLFKCKNKMFNLDYPS